jgi:hypothetical protein
MYDFEQRYLRGAPCCEPGNLVNAEPKALKHLVFPLDQTLLNPARNHSAKAIHSRFVDHGMETKTVIAIDVWTT